MTPSERAEHFGEIRKGLLRDAPHRLFCPDDQRLLAAVVRFEGDRYLWTFGGHAGELAERRQERKAAPGRARAGLAELEEHAEVWRAEWGDQAHRQMIDQASADVERAVSIAEPAEHPTDRQRWAPQALLIAAGDHRTIATACQKCRRLRAVEFDERSDTLTILQRPE